MQLFNHPSQLAKYNRGANKLTPSKTAFIVFPTLYAGGVYQDGLY